MSPVMVQKLYIFDIYGPTPLNKVTPSVFLREKCSNSPKNMAKNTFQSKSLMSPVMVQKLYVFDIYSPTPLNKITPLVLVMW